MESQFSYIFASISNIIMTKIKVIKHTFCSPLPQIDTIKYKIQKDQYFTFLIYIFMTTIFLFWTEILGNYHLTTLQLFSPVHIIMLYLMIKKNLKAIKFIFLAMTIVFPVIMILESSFQHYLLSIPILQIILIILNMIMTYSIYSSMISFTINYMISKSILINKLGEIYQVKSNDIRYHMFEEQISTQFNFGLVLMIVVILYLRSNKKIIVKLTNEKAEIQIQNNKLLKSNNELQENIKSKISLFQSIVHELRNPLNIISGSAQLALMKNLHSANIEQYLENIDASTDMIKYFVNNLLDAAKMQQIDLECSPTLINASTFFEKAWATSKILIERKRLIGALFVSKNMPQKLNIDKIRIMQIIYNLVGNAVKFTPKGYIAIICTSIN